jgi:hypothetical protein
MSTQLLISALRRGNTGNEILNILDAITTKSPQVEDSAAPTLEEIEF